MRIQRTYYEVMGLPREASSQQVKTKYHELARQFHPDRAQDKVLAERLFVQINLAYRTLADPDKRAVYDASLFQADVAAGLTSGAGTSAGTGAAAGAAAQARPSAPAAPPRPKVNLSELLERANAAYLGGDRITTHKLCMEALRADPNSAEAHALLGDVYADQGRRPDALNEYRTAQRAGDSRVSLQAKIKRLEGLVGGAGAGQQTQRPSSGSATPPPASGTPRPQPQAQSDPKKSGFLDRFITRKTQP